MIGGVALQTLKQRRRELLMQIDKYSERRCENCKLGKGNNAKMDCICMASIKIRELGSQLDSLVNKRSWESELNGIRKRGRITVLEYIDLQIYDITDERIAEVLGVPAYIFRNWRRERNVIGVKRMNKENLDNLKSQKGHMVFIAKYHKGVKNDK